MKISALVCAGHGINCERETRYALELAGFDIVDIGHLNFIANGDVNPLDYNLVVFPGGFMDGDDLGAAQACVNRIRHSNVHGRKLVDVFIEFIQKNGLVLGICNGFQLLVKLGMLPGSADVYTQRTLSLTANACGRFEDRWVYLTIDDKSPCVYTQGLKRMYLPVRHGEGKLISSSPELTATLLNSGRIPMRYCSPDSNEPTMVYPSNPNGSEHAIAGVCDETGRVFGLMPHPECFVNRDQHPRWTREDLPEEGQGLAIFRNAAKYLREN